MCKQEAAGNGFGRVLLVFAFMLFVFKGPGFGMFTAGANQFVNWTITSMQPESVEQ